MQNNYNSITGLYNRDYLLNTAPKRLENETHILVALIDIVSLTQIEMFYGYDTKEDFVTNCTKTLSQYLSDSEIIGHLDTQSVLLLLPNWKEERFLKYIKDTTQAIDSYQYLSNISSGHSNLITYTYWTPKSQSLQSVLLECKLTQDYISPIDSCILKYESFMKRDLEEKASIMSNIISAIQHDEFEIWFQGQFSSSTNQLIGYEALTRWKDKNNQFIPPNRFIPIINQSKHYIHFNQYIIKKIVKTFEVLKAHYETPIKLSINISPTFFMHPEFVAYINEVVQASTLKRSEITLEITEDIFIEEYEKMITQIKELRHEGYHISLDDFGSGYSSLSHISFLDINEIKIDRTLIQQCIDNEKSLYLIESIKFFADRMNIQTIAEGVETTQDVHKLKAIGFDLIQGYVFAKPEPVENIILKETTV